MSQSDGGTIVSEESEIDEHARISDFMAQISQENFNDNDESISSLKKVVKRLIKNDNEQSGFQVFFGNEKLLMEWLMGAAATGQPGIDYPMLTKIPATSFSCRGIKGGYYADLETNCQVFHICDNGRKISFLCPNGTIFQQSQLICDWWFKVDCSKSTELYEQSAEQLADDERKRADAKRINSEFRRPSLNNDDVGEKYHRTSKTNYDGKQNGRTNPYGNAAKNQLTEIEQRPEINKQTSPRSFDPNQIYSQQNTRTNNQFSQINDLAPVDGSNSNGKVDNNDDNYNDNDDLQNNQNSRISVNYQSLNTQRNQLTNDGDSNVKQQYNNDKKSSKYSSQSNRYQDVNDYNSQATGQRNNNRGRKFKAYNLDEDDGNVRATPLYTETTTFRTSTPTPIKEYQQLAESAAFATTRGNRVNKVYSNTHFNYRTNEVSTAASALQPTTASKSRIVNSQFRLVPKKDIPAFPHSTFAPIYKPRTTIYDQTTLTNGGGSTNVNKWDRQDGTTATDFDQLSTTPYSIVQNFQDSTTYSPSRFTHDATETSEWISTTPNYSNTIPSVTSYFREGNSPNQFTSQRLRNTELYNDNNRNNNNNNREFSRSTYTTPRVYSNSQTTSELSTNLETTTESYGADYQDSITNIPINNATFDKNSTRSQGNNNHGERNGRYRAAISRNSMRNWQYYRQNSISSSTEKSIRSNPSFEQQNSANGKTLRPYDTSFTYQQGKVMSTILPYIPFTKNYAYTTTTSTTTLRPPVYTATVPTYTTPTSQYREGSQTFNTFNTINNVTPTSINGIRKSSTYLPDIKSDISSSRRTNLDERPAMERQHALNMLQSLRGLEGTVPTFMGNSYGNRSGLKVPHSSSPATLHSLALYFSTAGNTIKSFDNDNNNLDSIRRYSNNSELSNRNEKLSNQNKNQIVEFPSSILTQHTINSYVDLFNLNNALEINSTANMDFSQMNDDENSSEDFDNEDLDLQQSEGPLNGVKKSNSTKLRELAKIFTHALSAYLQDPDTFKKILAEIRPTVPSLIDDDTALAVTSLLPTTIDDYPSVTKEKDEVLDFSDDVTPSKFKRPTTIIPTTTTTENSAITDDSGFGYYTTSYESPYQTTTFAPYNINQRHSISSQNSTNDFASQVNNAFNVYNNNNEYDRTTRSPDVTFNDAPIDYENYFPSGDSTYNNEVGDIQQNNTTTYEPYGKYVKPPDSKPIQYDNYEQSSTPSSYEQTLPPVNHENNEFAENIASALGENSNVPSTTGEPFRIRYYDEDSTTTESGKYNGEFLVTANSINPNYNNINYNNGVSNNNGVNNNYQQNSKNTQRSSRPFTSTPSSEYTESFQSYRNFNDKDNDKSSEKYSNKNSVENDSKLNNNDNNNHWTSSPTVTQLWESTVFYDPKRINQGLISQKELNPSSNEYSDNEFRTTTNSPNSASQEILVTDAANGITSHIGNTQSSPSSWQWSTTTTDTEGPTMFTLLPNTYSTDQTATPNPIYTTRSSITTTITSSITSEGSLPANNGLEKLNGDTIHNTRASVHDNEIIRAKKMFGNLNASSTDTLMNVMKHADENPTVRQLVLLLINHCNGPMNKTMEQEKEQLLNALLRTPVNEFTSKESRQIIAGISQLNLPIGNSEDDLEAKSSTHFTTSPKPVITTYRNKNSRRVSVNDGKILSAKRAGNSNNRVKSVNETDSAASDERALELLRSLYSVAAKWG
ncbi:hypothetical protein PV327_002527 [Microctonus hyperodae]|uniref:Chitin-binding type-2 domain-containing protein n=1 Tax=Microctonus hyperodae TaxID=165561 RepID=A0AA39FFR3_MICHY|nr:hypothetical protein PV327_002527 [Microctonus hyperodae]